MDYFDYSSTRKKTKEKTEFDLMEEMEMCDICCHSYHVTYMRRVPYTSDTGTVYHIRVCPNCKAEALTQYL